MSLFSNFINQLFVKKPIVSLGRWNIVYCQEKINKKIDLSNEDHCGACYNSNFISNNNISNNNISNNNKNKKSKNYDIKTLIFFETM